MARLYYRANATRKRNVLGPIAGYGYRPKTPYEQALRHVGGTCERSTEAIDDRKHGVLQRSFDLWSNEPDPVGN